MEHLAYLDMATGSMLIQAVIGGALAGIFILRNAIAQLVLRLGRVVNRRATVDEEE